SPSGPLRTVVRPMQRTDWTTKPCAQEAAAGLARELDVSETTARVLLRRGYESADAAAAFLEGEMPGHDPFLLGDMTGAVEAIKGAVSAGRRASGLPGCRDPAVRLSVPGAVRHRGRLQARRGAPRARSRGAHAPPRSRRPGDDLRCRSAHRREPRARARGPALACSHAE